MLITFHSSTHRPVSGITQTESNYDDDVKACVFPLLRFLSTTNFQPTMENYISLHTQLWLFAYKLRKFSLRFFAKGKSATQHDMIITHNDSLFCTNKTLCEAKKEIKNLHLLLMCLPSSRKILIMRIFHWALLRVCFSVVAIKSLHSACDSRNLIFPWTNTLSHACSHINMNFYKCMLNEKLDFEIVHRNFGFQNVGGGEWEWEAGDERCYECFVSCGNLD